MSHSQLKEMNDPYNSLFIYLDRFDGDEQQFYNLFNQQMKTIQDYLKLKNPALYTACFRKRSGRTQVNVLFHNSSQKYCNLLMWRDENGKPRVNVSEEKDFKKPKEIISRIRHEIARLKDDLFTASTIKGIDWNELYDIEEEQEKLKETIEELSKPRKIYKQLASLVEIKEQFTSFCYGREHTSVPYGCVSNVVETLHPLSWIRDNRTKQQVAKYVRGIFAKYVSDKDNTEYPKVAWNKGRIKIIYQEKTQDAQMAVHMSEKRLRIKDFAGKMQNYPLWYEKFR